MLAPLLMQQPAQAATVVTNTNDSGRGSLRQAIADAPAGDTISFAPGVTGAITLTSGAINLTKNVTIQGPGAGTLAPDGGGGGVPNPLPPSRRDWSRDGNGALRDMPAVRDRKHLPLTRRMCR
jgi:hypothetical protein